MATIIHQYNNSDYAFAQKRLQQYVRRGRITQAQLDQMMHHLQTLETKGQLASGIDEAGNVKSNAAIYAYKMVQAKELLHPEEYVGKNKERVSDKVGGNHREALNTLYRADADENALAEAAKSVAGVENLITTRGQTNLAVRARGMSFNRQGKAGFETIELQDVQPSQNEGQSAQTTQQPMPMPQKDPHIDDPVDKDGSTKLMIACRDGKTDEVKDLLAKGADVHAKNNNGQTPLYYASWNNAEVTKVLIANGADVNAKDNDEQTPLHYAKNAEVAQVLIANGADVHAKDANGQTPLHWTYNPEVAQTLINAGADVHAKDANGQTPLYFAENAEVAQVLIDNKAEVNIKDKYDQTPLHFAKNAEIAQTLINAGSDVNTQRDDGGTPLHLAKNAEIAQVLIANGADVHAQNKYGSTPLHYAKNAEIAQVLIANGADVHAKDNNGQTPQSYIAAKVKESEEDKKAELQAVLDVINQAQKNTPQAQKVATQPNNAQAQTNTNQTTTNLANTLGKNSQNVTEELETTRGISLDTSRSMA